MLTDNFMHLLVDSKEYGLTTKDASTLLTLDDGDRLDYYLDIVQMLRTEFADEPAILSRIGKVAGNWYVTDLTCPDRLKSINGLIVEHPAEIMRSSLTHV
jgi:aspartyl-tRNA(Asn)/glutamyl-tRNA(Gln) amidotransferase subunit B